MSAKSKCDNFDNDENNDIYSNSSVDNSAASTSHFSKQHDAKTIASPTQIDAQPVGRTEEGAEVGRYVYSHNGRKIYEWEQNLEEVNLYIDAPPGKSASDFEVSIQSRCLKIGLKGNDRLFIDEETFSKVNTSESSWYLDSNIIHIVLMKVHRGETWEAALLGQDRNSKFGNGGLVDPITKEKIKQDLVLQRFQEENPGFDFRGAKFNGEAPDPRTFLGGIRHD